MGISSRSSADSNSTKSLRDALTKSGVPTEMRPFHDIRHSAITNAAAAGAQGPELMAWAGHADFGTTKRYIDLRDQASRTISEKVAQRVWGRMVRTPGTKTAARLQIRRQRPPLCRTEGSRGDRTRTCNPRFWRPVLYQLSYAPRFERDCSGPPLGHDLGVGRYAMPTLFLRVDRGFRA